MKSYTILIFCLIAGLLLQGENSKYLSRRQEMVEKQISYKGITNQKILDAFLKVKRHLFVRPEFRQQAYSEMTLPLDEGESIQQPYHVAILTYVIAPELNKKVLEIGTGSGYHSAILAELTREVYTIEINEKLANQAKKKLDLLGYKNIKFKIGNGYIGWKKYAPFDCIIVTCSPDHIPPPLINQLAVNGRMVISISFSSSVQELILIEKDDKGNLKTTNLIPVDFRQLIRGKRDQ